MPLSHLMEEIDRPASRFRHRPSRSQRDGEGPEPVAGAQSGPRSTDSATSSTTPSISPSRQVRLAAEWTDSDSCACRSPTTGRAIRPTCSTGSASPMSRPAARRRQLEPGNVEHGGLGLGIFIAKTLLERSGAQLRLANRKPPENGAMVTVEWPRAAFEQRSAQPLSQSRRNRALETLIERGIMLNLRAAAMMRLRNDARFAPKP